MTACSGLFIPSSARYLEYFGVSQFGSNAARPKLFFEDKCLILGD